MLWKVLGGSGAFGAQQKRAEDYSSLFYLLVFTIVCLGGWVRNGGVKLLGLFIEDAHVDSLLIPDEGATVEIAAFIGLSTDDEGVGVDVYIGGFRVGFCFSRRGRLFILLSLWLRCGLGLFFGLGLGLFLYGVCWSGLLRFGLWRRVVALMIGVDGVENSLIIRNGVAGLVDGEMTGCLENAADL